MKRKRLYIFAGAIVVLVAVAIFVAVSQISLRPEERVQAAGPVERPFGMWTEEVLVDEKPTDTCPFGQASIKGSGHASHLGKVTLVRTHCFDPNSDPQMTGGHWEAVAANGDRVWGSYFGRSVPTAFDDQGNPIQIAITAPYTLDGGTGRFEGVTGEGTTTGEFDLVTGKGDFATEGWIWY